MDWQKAAARLDLAFASKAAAAGVAGGRLVAGVFGNGLPPALLIASDCLGIDVKSAPEGERPRMAAGISDYVEQFVDDYARLFLSRLFDGAFSRLPAIIFSRDDAAALVAYQYASEYMRQHRLAERFPRLLLWNTVSGDSPAVAAFNRRQAEALWTALEALGGRYPSTKDIAAAIAVELDRAEALAELESWRQGPGPRVSGTEALRWRNAGRFLPPEEHAGLLRAVIPSLGDRPPRRGPRIGLVGAATDAEGLYAALELEGTIVCDPQPFGTVWPGPCPPAGAGLDDLLEVAARDPLLQRAKSAVAHRSTIVAACVAAECDVVVAQIDQNDDTFGWDWPALAAELEQHGIAALDLGFRDHRPGPRWCEQARARLAGVAGGRHG